MGIPSYFSQIIRKYGNIIHKLNKDDKTIHNLYLDSNSIIYDALHELKRIKEQTKDAYEIALCHQVCIKIQRIIDEIKPTDCVFIAFDGVAPLAKMKQQRERRYKSHIISSLQKNINQEDDILWNKTAITPGTEFMKLLNHQVTEFFNNPDNGNEHLNIIVSGSHDVGEGEHKIFSFIRQNKSYHKKRNNFIYGLDSDLIMLCLNHLHISNNIFLIREMPSFVSVLQGIEIDDWELYYLDIHMLRSGLMKEMGCETQDSRLSKMKILDYVFITFMLGNDFLPHFPALNIRTSGMDILLETYHDIIPPDKYINDGERINWKLFKKFIRSLSQLEEDIIQKEYKDRGRFENRFYPVNTDEERIMKMNAIPVRFRKTEHYIDPFTPGWKDRYYAELLHITNKSGSMKKKLCVNYLEGLEWTMKYYHKGCINYRWEYKHDYPPLLCDLIKYIPEFDTVFVSRSLKPVNELTQLCYVIPKWSFELLPEILHESLLDKFGEHYSESFPLEWSYCKYLWESHPVMSRTNLDEFEEFINNTVY